VLPANNGIAHRQAGTGREYMNAGAASAACVAVMVDLRIVAGPLYEQNTAAIGRGRISGDVELSMVSVRYRHERRGTHSRHLRRSPNLDIQRSGEQIDRAASAPGP